MPARLAGTWVVSTNFMAVPVEREHARPFFRAKVTPFGESRARPNLHGLQSSRSSSLIIAITNCDVWYLLPHRQLTRGGEHAARHLHPVDALRNKAEPPPARQRAVGNRLRPDYFSEPRWLQRLRFYWNGEGEP